MNKNKVMYKIQVVILTILAVSFMFSASWATTYYVAKNGKDSNSGTDAKPWLTIQKAANTAVAGDIVYVKAGIYKERVIPKNSGSKGNYITYQNYPAHEVIIDGENSTRNTCIYVVDKRYLRFKGLKLRGAIAGFYAYGPASNLILDGLTSENNYYGIYFSGYDASISDSTIKNCEVRNNDEHGIFLYRRNYDILIDHNHVSYSGWDKYWGHNIKVVVWDGDDPATGPVGITITNNELDHARVQGIMTWNARNLLIRGNHSHHNGATGIQIEDGSKNVIVEDNTCEYNAQKSGYETGIWVDSTENAVVQNNIIRYNNIGLMVSGSEWIIVRNNLIYKNNRGPDQANYIGISIQESHQGEGGGSDISIVHNTLYKNGSSKSQRADINIGTYGGKVYRVFVKNNIVAESAAPRDLWVQFLTHVLDYNNYYNIRNLLIKWQGNDKTWTKYLSASGQDFHSITSNPHFVNPDIKDFRLQNNSLCIDKGGFLTKTTSSVSGKIIKVENARYFTDGYGLIDGDLIKVGSNSPVRITNVNYNANTITVDKNISCNIADGVSYPYSGSAPDIGTYEYEGGSSKPTPPTGLTVIPST
jgi:parallel beta-helix repeat protein